MHVTCWAGVGRPARGPQHPNPGHHDDVADPVLHLDCPVALAASAWHGFEAGFLLEAECRQSAVNRSAVNSHEGVHSVHQ